MTTTYKATMGGREGSRGSRWGDDICQFVGRTKGHELCTGNLCPQFVKNRRSFLAPEQFTESVKIVLGLELQNKLYCNRASLVL